MYANATVGATAATAGFGRRSPLDVVKGQPKYVVEDEEAIVERLDVEQLAVGVRRVVVGLRTEETACWQTSYTTRGVMIHRDTSADAARISRYAIIIVILHVQSIIILRYMSR